MKCSNCPAKNETNSKCLIGVFPYPLHRTNEYGCCYNNKQVQKSLKKKGIIKELPLSN